MYGIDIAEEGVKKADQKLRDLKTCAALTTGSIFRVLPYDTDFFDGIISVKVLHHGRIEDIQKVIKEIERVLKPKGFIFVSVRKPASNQKRLCEKDPRTYVGKKGILHSMFTRPLLRKEFDNFAIHDLWVGSGGYYCLFGELKTG